MNAINREYYLLFVCLILIILSGYLLFSISAIEEKLKEEYKEELNENKDVYELKIKELMDYSKSLEKKTEELEERSKNIKYEKYIKNSNSSSVSADKAIRIISESKF